jgi:predicted Zn finger-like uncharacterized protein
LLTQCPNCQTTFRVTSEILRVAHGQVRCGRCQTQFDALERLIEEGAATDSGRFARPTPPSPPRTDIDVEEPAHEDITLEGRHIEISGIYPIAEGADDGDVRQEVTEEWVDIEDPEANDDPDEEVEFETGEEAAEYATDADAEAELEVTDDEVAADAHDATEVEADESLEDQAMLAAAAAHRRRARETATSEPDFDLATTPRRAPTPLLWKVLPIPFALLLIVQIVDHYSPELARHPRIGPPLVSLYHALHLQLTPDWNLHAYEIKQWGVMSDPASPGTLRVRASVTNLASFPQPYPLLRLVLEDRWGEQVRAREFEPSEYLDPTSAPDRLLAPSQRANATIAILDPGPDAEGFSFDVCLRGRTGAICAAEVPHPPQ